VNIGALINQTVRNRKDSFILGSIYTLLKKRESKYFFLRISKFTSKIYTFAFVWTYEHRDGEFKVRNNDKMV
jgi:hypothetical protein